MTAVVWTRRGEVVRIVTARRARDEEKTGTVRYSPDRIAADPDDARETPDWTRAVKGLPPRKEPIKLRIDADVIGWFRKTGKGYQTRMNNVLRAFVESRKSAGQ